MKDSHASRPESSNVSFNESGLLITLPELLRIECSLAFILELFRMDLKMRSHLQVLCLEVVWTCFRDLKGKDCWLTFDSSGPSCMNGVSFLDQRHQESKVSRCSKEMKHQM